MTHNSCFVIPVTWLGKVSRLRKTWYHIAKSQSTSVDVEQNPQVDNMHSAPLDDTHIKVFETDQGASVTHIKFAGKMPTLYKTLFVEKD